MSLLQTTRVKQGYRGVTKVNKFNSDSLIPNNMCYIGSTLMERTLYAAATYTRYGHISHHEYTSKQLKTKGTQSKNTSNQEHLLFIKSVANAARSSELKTGVPASITIAQAIVESGWGEHHAGNANNYFGVKPPKGSLKCGDVAIGIIKRPTWEHENGRDVRVPQPFCKYRDMSDSFLDHGLFIKRNHHYRSILEAYAKTGKAKDFAEGLQKAHYATDPHYAKKLIDTMDAHELYQYNITAVVKSPPR